MQKPTIWVVVVALGVFSLPGVAQDDDGFKREIKHVKLRIKQMRAKADELEEKGSNEDAAELREQANEMAKRMYAAIKQRDKAAGKKAEGRYGKKSANKKKSAKSKKGGDVTRGLEAGIKALRSMGGHEKVVAYLKKLLAKTQANRVEKAKRHREDDRRVERDRDRERDMRRNRDRRGEAEGFGPRRGRGGPPPMRELMERVERMERRLEEVTHLLEKMIESKRDRR